MVPYKTSFSSASPRKLLDLFDQNVKRLYLSANRLSKLSTNADAAIMDEQQSENQDRSIHGGRTWGTRLEVQVWRAL